MIAAIRIHGKIGLNVKIKETMERLRLRKKYVCVILNENDVTLGMLKKVKDFIAYGNITNDVFEKLVDARGKPLDKNKKINAKKVVEEISKGKKFDEVNLKPFFSLHPPLGGIDSKKHAGVKKGVLGKNKEINELILRML